MGEAEVTEAGARADRPVLVWEMRAGASRVWSRSLADRLALGVDTPAWLAVPQDSSSESPKLTKIGPGAGAAKPGFRAALQPGRVWRVCPDDATPETLEALTRAAAQQGCRQVLLAWHDPLLRLAALSRALPPTPAPPSSAETLPLLQAAKRMAAFLRQDQRGLVQWARVKLLLSLSGAIAEEFDLGDFAEELEALKAEVAVAQFAALEREAHWSPPLGVLPCLLKPVVATMEAASGPVALVRLRALPAALSEGDAISLQGFVVAQGPAEGKRLALKQGDGVRALPWHLPSQSFHQRFPEMPGSDRARFKPTSLLVRRREPIGLCLRTGAKKSLASVASVEFLPHGPERILGLYVAGLGIGYQPLPKVACTSIKEALFRLAFGQAYSPDMGLGLGHVHAYVEARMRDVGAAPWKFTVVRDPIKRFLSGYSNRVRHHKELSRGYVSRLQLVPPLDLESFPFDPDIHQFIEHFEFYRRIPTINHHLRPVSDALAPLEAFDKVYPFEALDELSADLSERAGQPVPIPHTQRGGKKIGLTELSQAEVEKLVRIFAADYQLLARFYSPPGRKG